MNDTKPFIILFILPSILFIGGFIWAAGTSNAESVTDFPSVVPTDSSVAVPSLIRDFTTLPYVEPIQKQTNETIILATVTAYNTTVAQCDNSPCRSADGSWVCDDGNYVACPNSVPFGILVGINGIRYICNDRVSSKYPNRFDINFNKDIEGAKKFGKQLLEVTIYD